MNGLPNSVTSLRPRGGIRFEPTKELELLDSALSASRNLPGANQGLLLIQEVAGPFGIPDLIAITGVQDVIDQRMELDIPPILNEIDAAIVGAVSSRAPRRLETVSKTLGWPQETVERRVPALVRMGALAETHRKTLLKPEALRPIGQLFAIETKVSNWRRAIRQGRMYQVWCDSYVVVMGPLSDQPLAKLVDAASQDDAGVVVDGGWKATVTPRPRPSWRRLLGSEYVVAALGHSG